MFVLGVLGRDLSELCAEEMASTIGVSAPHFSTHGFCDSKIYSCPQNPTHFSLDPHSTVIMRDLTVSCTYHQTAKYSIISVRLCDGITESATFGIIINKELFLELLNYTSENLACIVCRKIHTLQQLLHQHHD